MPKPRSPETLSSHPLRALLPTKSPSPTLRCLSECCLRKFIEFNELVGSTSREAPTLSESQLATRGRKIAEIAKEWGQLISLIFPSVERLSIDKGMYIANLMRQESFASEEVEQVLKRIGKKAAGRPASRRAIAIRARDMWIADSKRSWPEITRALCACGKGHTIKCQDNIRRQKLHLEKSMKRLGCDCRMREKPHRVFPMR